jgi:hypothetical protein
VMDITVRYMPSEKNPGGTVLKHSTKLCPDGEDLRARFARAEEGKWAFVVERWGKAEWKVVYHTCTRSAKSYGEYTAKLAEEIAYIAVDGVTYWSNPTIDECLRDMG